MPKTEASLVDEIMDIAAGRKATTCAVCEKLTNDQKAAIKEARDRGASYPAITQWIHGKVGQGTLTFHHVRGHFMRGH